jgi:integrase
MITFLKPGESLGVYIDSEEPYFRFKIETNYTGSMRTLLLPEEFSAFPEKLTGKARISKIFPNTTPYTSIINMDNDDASEVVNNILKESYQTKSKVITSDSLDQSIMFTKLPRVEIKKVIEDLDDIPLSEYILQKNKFVTSVFKNHILSHLANTPMKDLKKNQVMHYHSSMVKDKGLAPATANKFLVFLSNAYHLSHQFELLPSDINPCKGVKEFELNNQRQIFLTNTQAKRLLKYVQLSPNKHLEFIIPMLLLSGARKREVLDAQWSDFDMLNKLWTIPITKNGKKRILPITPPLQELLESIPKQSKYLFASPKTKKPYVSIFVSWNTARIKAGLPEIRIHDLRHTYASALVNAKCSLYEVQMLLGHSTAKMTQRYVSGSLTYFLSERSERPRK